MISLGLTGRMVTGKDTRADVLCQLLPGTMRLSFATALKVEVAERHGISPLELERDKASYRSELQEVGEEGRKTMKWVLLMEDVLRGLEQYSIDEGKDYAPAAVITDVRHQDEVDLLQDYGFEVVRLEAPQEVLQDRYYKKHGVYITQAQWDHPSEQAESLLVDSVWDAEGVPKTQIQAWIFKNQLRDMGKKVRGLFKS